MKTLKRHGKSHLLCGSGPSLRVLEGKEGGVYIEMATLPNTMKWITPG